MDIQTARGIISDTAAMLTRGDTIVDYESQLSVLSTASAVVAKSLECAELLNEHHVKQHKAANELKIWGEEKPDVGRYVNLYLRYSDYGLWAQVCEHNGEVVVDGPETRSMQRVWDIDRWCYVPGPPDWDAIGRGDGK